MMMEQFKVTSIPAVHSRKSCNCGCDIKKEAYIIAESDSRFEAYDFCDSQVFEWHSSQSDGETLINSIQNGLAHLGYLHLQGISKISSKFKTTKYRIEGHDNLTFLELTRYKNRRIKLKVSIATP